MTTPQPANEQRQEIQAYAWAACPRLDEQGDPKYFKTKKAGERFLRSEILRLPDAGLPHEEEPLEARLGRRARRQRELIEKSRQIKSGKLRHFSFPQYLLPIRNSDRGVRLVPIRDLPGTSGQPCNHRFSNFLTMEKLGSPSESTDSQIDRAFEGRWPDYVCALSPDCFVEIEEDAEKRQGHEFVGRKHRSIAAIVLRAVYDLEESLFRAWPSVTNLVVADFFQSWQFQRHIAVFCKDIIDKLRFQVSPLESFAMERAAPDARHFIYVQAACYAHELRSVSPTTCPAETPAPQPDPHVDVVAANDRSDAGEPVRAGNAGGENGIIRSSRQTTPPTGRRKGDIMLLKKSDGSLRESVDFPTAEAYAGITARRRQQLFKGITPLLNVLGKGQRRRITVESLIAYCPPIEDAK